MVNQLELIIPNHIGIPGIQQTSLKIASILLSVILEDLSGNQSSLPTISVTVNNIDDDQVPPLTIIASPQQIKLSEILQK